MGLHNLPRLTERQPAPQPKGVPTPIRRRQRKSKNENLEDRFRKAVWKRDGPKSRASLKPVWPNETDPTKRGEVAHLRSRSSDPARKYLRSNGVLLTAEEHQLSDARTAPGSQVLLQIRGVNADKLLTFIRTDINGRELWRRTT